MHQNPKSYSRIAIAVSAALTSMVFSAHAAWIDIDGLPSSGLVSSLPPGCRLYFLLSDTSFAKTSATPNYVYRWSAGTIPVFGHGLTLNGLETKPSNIPLPALFRTVRRVARALFSVTT